MKEEARKVISAANAAYHEALDRENLIRQSLDEQRARVQNLQGASAEYNQTKAELENERQMLQGLLRRHSETSISADLADRLSATRNDEDKQVTIKVIEKAEIPGAAYAPARRRRALIIVLLGLVLGVGTAYVIDHWDDSIHTVEDLKRHVPLPYLGMIPRYGENAALAHIGKALGRGDGKASAPLAAGARSVEATRASKRSNYLPSPDHGRPRSPRTAIRSRRGSASSGLDAPEHAGRGAQGHSRHQSRQKLGKTSYRAT